MRSHKIIDPGEADNTTKAILNKLEIIKKAGFGEVRVLIRNGAIYRILTTQDEAVTKE